MNDESPVEMPREIQRRFEEAGQEKVFRFFGSLSAQEREKLLQQASQIDLGELGLALGDCRKRGIERGEGGGGRCNQEGRGSCIYRGRGTGNALGLSWPKGRIPRDTHFTKTAFSTFCREHPSRRTQIWPITSLVYHDQRIQP